jgi:hypothetical protein
LASDYDVIVPGHDLLACRPTIYAAGSPLLGAAVGARMRAAAAADDLVVGLALGAHDHLPGSFGFPVLAGAGSSGSPACRPGPQRSTVLITRAS